MVELQKVFRKVDLHSALTRNPRSYLLTSIQETKKKIIIIIENLKTYSLIETCSLIHILKMIQTIHLFDPTPQ